MEESTLTEARRASWDVSYTDLMPFIKAELTHDGLIAITTDLPAMRKKIFHTGLLGRKSEKTGNTIGFDVRKAARVAIRDVLKQIEQADSPNTRLDELVTIAMSKTPEYGGWNPDFHAAAVREAERYKQRGYTGMTEPRLQEIVTSDAYMKAIIAVFFNDSLEQYKAKKKDRVFRALDMSGAEKSEVMEWFKQHITNMQFRFPENDNESYCGLLSIPETDLEARDKSSKKVEDRWAKGFNAFMSLCPNAVEGRDYKMRLTSEENDPHKYLWNPSCTITIDLPFAQAPEAAKGMLARVKSRKDAKDYDDAVNDNVISSYWLGIAILEMFGGDLNFYDKRRRNAKDSEGSDFSDSLINDYIN